MSSYYSINEGGIYSMSGLRYVDVYKLTRLEAALDITCIIVLILLTAGLFHYCLIEIFEL